MTARRLPSRRLIAALVASGALLAACDPASSLSATNNSSMMLLLRYTEAPSSDPDYHPAAFVWELPPGGEGIAIPRALGDAPGTVEVLSEDCRALASWPSRHGGMVTVDTSGVSHFEDTASAPGGGGPNLRESTSCR